MFAKLQKIVDELKASEPGRRLQDHYDRQRHEDGGRWTRGRVLKVMSGVGLIIVGAIIAPIPGPGGIVALPGLALIAGEFRPAAILADRAEVLLRRIVAAIWTEASPAVRAVTVIVALALLAGFAWGAYAIFFAPKR